MSQERNDCSPRPPQSLKTFLLIPGSIQVGGIRLARPLVTTQLFDFMSQLLIQQYLNELSDLRRVSGTNREQVVREAFKSLLKDSGRSHQLIFVPEAGYRVSAFGHDPSRI